MIKTELICGNSRVLTRMCEWLDKLGLIHRGSVVPGFKYRICVNVNAMEYAVESLYVSLPVGDKTPKHTHVFQSAVLMELSCKVVRDAINDTANTESGVRVIIKDNREDKRSVLKEQLWHWGYVLRMEGNELIIDAEEDKTYLLIRIDLSATKPDRHFIFNRYQK